MKKMAGLCAALCATVTAIVAAFPAAASESKTLARSEDPIVVKASELSALSDVEIGEMALMAMEGGAAKPVPFQVDEKASDGRYVYDNGPEADPGKGDGKYNGEDELVFMAWDSGDQAPADYEFPCDPDKVIEVEIKDPSGGKAWAYAVECNDEAPLSDVDYVQHEAAGDRDWVKTGRYHFSEKRGESFFDRLALKGSDGKVGPNLADRIKGRNRIAAVGGLIEKETPESGLKGSIQAWIDGPVRVVHLMTAYIELSGFSLKIGGQSENLFYPNMFVTPIRVDLPVSPSSIFSEFEMRYAIDWNEKMNGAKYYDPVNKAGVAIDGKMSDAEKNMDFDTGHEWYALTGSQGNIMVRMVLPEKWAKLVPLKLYYVDDVNEPDPPESDPGQRCAGFLMDTMVDIPSGNHLYSLYYMVPDKAPPASAPDMLKILDKPLKISGKEIAD